jgi:hypothetical protein
MFAFQRASFGDGNQNIGETSGFFICLLNPVRFSLEEICER